MSNFNSKTKTISLDELKALTFHYVKGVLYDFVRQKTYFRNTAAVGASSRLELLPPVVHTQNLPICQKKIHAPTARLTDFNKRNSPLVNDLYKFLGKKYLAHKDKMGLGFCLSSDIKDSQEFKAMQLNIAMKRGLINPKTQVALYNQVFREIGSLLHDLQVLATWRTTLAVYQFDSEITDEIIKGGLLPLETPLSFFENLPTWGLYVDFGCALELTCFAGVAQGSALFKARLQALTATDDSQLQSTSYTCVDAQLNPLAGQQLQDHTDQYGQSFYSLKDGVLSAETNHIVGFWVSFDKMFDSQDPSLNLIINQVGNNISITIPLFKNGTLSDVLEYCKTKAMGDGVNDDHLFFMSAGMQLYTHIALSFLMWLCVQAPDISKMGQTVSPETLKQPRFSTHKVSGAFVPPSSPIVYNVGERLGQELRTYKQVLNGADTQGTDKVRKPMRPHIRKGHWHLYHHGKDRTKPKLHWVKATLVNAKTAT